MSRKHFNAIADAFRNTRPFKTDCATYLQWSSTVQAMARTLLDTNDRFDVQRFIEACKA